MPENVPNIADYPWTQAAWARLAGDTDGIHHALLITGVSGIAKREFAVALARRLLCDGAGDVAGDDGSSTGDDGSSASDDGSSTDDDGNRTDNQACGECRNCALFASATHPDFHVLTPETEWHDGRVDLIKKYCDRYQDIAAREKRAAPSRVIPVDQVRLLIERFGAHASIAARKIALIVPADRMNANAANALLKLLEEPPDGAVLILTSATPGYLPATIRSRCLQIPLPPPSAEVARQWLQNHLPEKAAERALQLTGGAPLDALKLHESGFLDLQNELQKGITELTAGKISALDLAAKLNKNDFQQTLDWLQRHNFQTIKKHHATEKSAPDQLPPEPLFALHDKITHYQKIARDQLNEQLALEELILSLQNAMQVK